MPKQTAKGPQLTTSDRSAVMTVIGLLAGLVETEPNPNKRVAATKALAANKAIIETHYPLPPVDADTTLSAAGLEGDEER